MQAENSIDSGVLVCCRFGISTKEVSLVFKCYIEILAKSLRPALLIFYTRQEIARTIPKEYGNYPKLRCIIDCSEIFIQKPSHMRLQAATWSDYKHHNTVKFLVAISPQGSIAFISKLWGGRTSDRHIVRSSGFLSHLNPQDQVLADRGFTVREELMMRGAELVLPPAGKGKAQMTPADVAKTKKVANVRIHVERVIQRIKTFRLISQVLPISLLSHADHIVTVCCALTNLKGPIVKEWNQVSE